jgi:hypothetical protein
MAASTFLTLFALLQGCGGGAGSAPTTQAGDLPPAEEKGELIITITDAPGDFLRYVVDVPQLTLYRANGDVVETLPFNTRIDFAELTEVSEFLTIASVPAGVYESVVLTLDYSAISSITPIISAIFLLLLLIFSIALMTFTTTSPPFSARCCA